MEESLALMLGGFIILFVIIFVIAIVLYVLKSIGLYGLASNAGIQNPWLAWLPIGDMYILAKLVKAVDIGGCRVPRIELVLPIGAAAVFILSPIPFLGTIICIAYTVVFFFALYKLFYIYRPGQAVLWLILSIVLFFIMPIFIFIMRNDRPRNPA